MTYRRVHECTGGAGLGWALVGVIREGYSTLRSTYGLRLVFSA